MISAWWLLLFIPAAFGLGMLALALALTAGDNKALHRNERD